mmetsp:Transcript_16182/g.24387  ORF Transcript_16182/g.24387 Transcript_16182/m.24387 type:complete len:339 (+) Transcript_16182:130-1146(+)|eukprot:CAMPEP_0185018054 /NCGR_PEP_ID=MMETSP1103-20130426/907_1 /TAXON_ID=36769 /ORGANISM="Paraphysomonas bandaiensis, Strain Caron Lab Isolate" /LENGTH=338 /DNA_ID=CAMNT_0027547743 /DNA_START=127 /DNA_END=1143 /DNA_ORIENTATION=+
MISRKNRPTDGPGANHLRGGPRNYSNKTAVGSWIENAGGASGYQRGFTTEEFMTEAQHQQNGNRKLKLFGAGLPQDDQIEDPRQVRDLFHPKTGPTSRDWKTNTHHMMDSVLVKKTEQSYRDDCVSPNKTSKHNVDEYRASWTMDTAEGRKQRFLTESRRAANSAVNENFQVPCLRLVPGTPIGFERLLEGLTERYGILGLTAFRAALGVGEKDSSEFQQALKSCQVKLSRVDFAQVMAHLTKGERFSAETLMRVITPDSEDFDPAKARSKYSAAFGDAESVSPEEVAALYRGMEAPLLRMIRTYCTPEGTIAPDGFTLMHSDMYHSVPIKYKAVIDQ